MVYTHSRTQNKQMELRHLSVFAKYCGHHHQLFPVKHPLLLANLPRLQSLGLPTLKSCVNQAACTCLAGVFTQDILTSAAPECLHSFSLSDNIPWVDCLLLIHQSVDKTSPHWGAIRLLLRVGPTQPGQLQALHAGLLSRQWLCPVTPKSPSTTPNMKTAWAAHMHLIQQLIRPISSAPRDTVCSDGSTTDWSGYE